MKNINETKTINNISEGVIFMFIKNDIVYASQITKDLEVINFKILDICI